MKITIQVSGRGNELTVGRATKEIMDFVSNECGDDGSAYLDKLDEDEVPENCKVQDGNVSGRHEFFDYAGIYEKHSINPHSDSFNVTVLCDGEEEFVSDDCELLVGSTNDVDIRTVAGVGEDDEAYFYYYATDEEMSCTISFEADSFDLNKLQMNVEYIDLAGEDWYFINSFEYDGKTYKLEGDFETDSVGDMFNVWW